MGIRDLASFQRLVQFRLGEGGVGAENDLCGFIDFPYAVLNHSGDVRKKAANANPDQSRRRGERQLFRGFGAFEWVQASNAAALDIFEVPRYQCQAVRLRGRGQQRIDDWENFARIQAIPDLRDSFVHW